MIDADDVTKIINADDNLRLLNSFILAKDEPFALQVGHFQRMVIINKEMNRKHYNQIVAILKEMEKDNLDVLNSYSKMEK